MCIRDRINAAESRVDLQRGTITENSASAKQQIASDIEFISKQMEENKAQIAKPVSYTHLCDFCAFLIK